MLSIHDAANYLRQLILPASRHACLAYWRERHGDLYVMAIQKAMKKNAP